MAVIEGGTSAALAEVGAAAAKGAHVIPKPQDHGALGHYQVNMVTGSIAAGMAANGVLFSARWTDATRFALVHLLEITGMRTSTAFAVGTIDINAIIGRSFTASHTGGTAITLTGDNQKLRTSMGTSLFGDMRISSTAALGGGTVTVDAQNLGTIATHSSGGFSAATPIIGSIYLPITTLFDARLAHGEHPIVLAQNEGVLIRGTVPATGVWSIGIRIKWSELTAF